MAKTIEVRGIWLRGDGSHLVVDVELADGRVVEAIREHSGHSEVVTISHHVSSSGIGQAPGIHSRRWSRGQRTGDGMSALARVKFMGKDTPPEFFLTLLRVGIGVYPAASSNLGMSLDGFTFRDRTGRVVKAVDGDEIDVYEDGWMLVPGRAPGGEP